VDRYGQKEAKVRTLTYYGQDNPVDGIVLEVLLRKHRAIHSSLGITVPVPMNTNSVVEAIFEGLLLRESGGAQQLSMDFLNEEKREVDVQWDAAVDRERRSRTLFAQRTIRVEEVAQELEATRRALGDGRSVEHFVRETLIGLGVSVSDDDSPRVDFSGAPAALKDAVGEEGRLRLAFGEPAPQDAVPITRTHPFVSGLASYVMESALDTAPSGNGARARAPAQRCAVIRTRDVAPPDDPPPPPHPVPPPRAAGPRPADASPRRGRDDGRLPRLSREIPSG
jgi:hypothetical protein